MSNAFIRNILCNSYASEFAYGNSPLLSRGPFAFDLPKVESAQVLLKEAVQKLLEKGAVEPVEDDRLPGFYSHLFLIPKRDGGSQPVIDLSYLYQYLQVKHFKMETPTSIMAAMRQNDWATLIDLKDAYFHIPVAKRSRKYLPCVVNGTVYQFQALPFGY